MDAAKGSLECNTEVLRKLFFIKSIPTLTGINSISTFHVLTVEQLFLLTFLLRKAELKRFNVQTAGKVMMLKSIEMWLVETLS